MDDNASQNDSLSPRSKSYGKWIIIALILIFFAILFFVIFRGPGESGTVIDEETNSTLSDVLVTRIIISQSPYLGIPNPGGGGGYYKQRDEITLTDSSGKFNFKSYFQWGRIFTIKYTSETIVRKVGYYQPGYTLTLSKLNLNILQQLKIDSLSKFLSPYDSQSLPSDSIKQRIKFNIAQINYILSNFPEVNNIPLDVRYYSYYSAPDYTEYLGDYLRRILVTEYAHTQRSGFSDLDVSLSEKEKICDSQINPLYFNGCHLYLFGSLKDTASCYKIKQIDNKSIQDRNYCDYLIENPWDDTRSVMGNDYIMA